MMPLWQGLLIVLGIPLMVAFIVFITTAFLEAWDETHRDRQPIFDTMMDWMVEQWKKIL